MRIFKTLRAVIKAIGLLDALIDECEREIAHKQEASKRVSKIYENVYNFTGKK